MATWQKTVADGTSNTDDFRILRPDGDVKWVHIERAPEFDETGNVVGFVGTSTDITERKADEARLRNYEQIADASPDLMTFIDRDFRYQTVNNAYLDAYGLPREQIVGRDITELYEAQQELRQALAERTHILENANISITVTKDRKIVQSDRPDKVLWGWSPEEYLNKDTDVFYADRKDYERIGRELLPVLAEGKRYETDVTFCHKDGHTIPVRIVGVAIDPLDLSRGSIWLTEDITERK